MGSVRKRTRGTVLVMVIGLLVMVFVMGTSYLFVARFEREVVRVELRGGAGAAGAIDGGGTSSLSGGGGGTGDLSVSLRLVLRDVLRQLRLDAVGADGIPYNDDLDGKTGSVREDAWDAPGSFAQTYDRSNPAPASVGDGLLSANEPYLAYEDPIDNGRIWKWFAVSSLRDNKPRLSYQPVLQPFMSLAFGAERFDLIRTRPLELNKWQFYSDADGDGYPDFLFVTQDRVYNGNAGDPVVPDLVAPEPEAAPDELDWESVIPSLPRNHKVALRVIGHGGMVLLDKDTPESLLLAATGRQNRNDIQLLGRNDAELDPAMEEVNLRRRFCLPPKYDPNASNDTARQVDPRTVFERDNQAWLQTRDSINQNMPRWNPMPFDLAQELLGGNGNYPSGGDHTTYQRNWMTLENNNTDYDRRHLVTTVAYDDLLRPLRNENDGKLDAARGNFIDALFRNENAYAPLANAVNPPPYGLADQTYLDSNNVRRWHPGLLRLVGYLPDHGLRTQDAEGNPLAGFTKFSLGDMAQTPGEGARLPSIEAYLRVLYGYYNAMLQRWEPTGPDDGPADSQGRLPADKNRWLRSIRAGALAINTWDYFDTFQGVSVDSTIVLKRTASFPEYAYQLSSGASEPRIVNGSEQIGIEGLPFISLIYKAGKYEDENADNPGEFNGWSIFAVELLNPWSDRIDFPAGDLRITVGDVPAYTTNTAIRLDPATIPGRINPGSRASNTAVISNVAIPEIAKLMDSDIDNASLDLANSDTVGLEIRLSDGTWFRIDELVINDVDEDVFSGDDGDAGAGVSAYDEWTSPEDHDNDNNYFGKYKAVVAKRVTAVGSAGADVSSREWRFAIGIEKVELLDPLGNPPKAGETKVGRDNEIDAPDRLKPVPLWFNNSGDAQRAFPTTGSLLLVNCMVHSRFVNPWTLTEKFAPLSTQLVMPLGTILGLQTEEDEDDDKHSFEYVDNGHMPVFDRRKSQMVVIDESDSDNANVPWGMLVFDYFTAIPLQSLRFEPAGAGQINSPQTTFEQYRDRYRAFLNVSGNQELRMPIVERTRTVHGNDPFGYGAKVRGRVNINLAPWNVLDGLPLVQSFGYAPVPELDRSGGAAFGKVLLTYAIDDHGDGRYTLSKPLAQAIVACREGRRLVHPDYGQTANEYIGRAGLSTPRRGPGFVTLGELATVIAGSQPAWRIDGGYADGASASYAEAICILASLADWATVRTNTYTVYATGAEVEEGSLLRGQWTVDRSRCLYSSELPEVIGPEVVVGYADAAGDPK